MAKSYDEILNEFKKELSKNDKLVQKEINSNDRDKMNSEFVEFINKNNCKIMNPTKKRGGKNGK